MAFLKRQNNGYSKKISGYQEFVERGERNTCARNFQGSENTLYDTTMMVVFLHIYLKL